MIWVSVVALVVSVALFGRLAWEELDNRKMWRDARRESAKTMANYEDADRARRESIRRVFVK